MNEKETYRRIKECYYALRNLPFEWWITYFAIQLVWIFFALYA